HSLPPQPVKGKYRLSQPDIHYRPTPLLIIGVKICEITEVVEVCINGYFTARETDWLEQAEFQEIVRLPEWLVLYCPVGLKYGIHPLVIRGNIPGQSQLWIEFGFVVSVLPIAVFLSGFSLFARGRLLFCTFNNLLKRKCLLSRKAGADKKKKREK